MDSDSNDDAPAISFTQLPKEIRLLVWEATFEPQYILLRFVEGCRPSSNIPVYAFKPYDDPKTPIALQVCQESRKVALQRYRPWKFQWYLHDRVERSKVVCTLLSLLFQHWKVVHVLGFSSSVPSEFPVCVKNF
jgi:hypothetical protein